MKKTLRSIGFVGIGNMGWGMATNLAKVGFDVVAFDTDADRVERFAHTPGARATTTLHDLGDCDIVITMLPTGAVARQVLLGEVGPREGLARQMKPGGIVVDMGSSEATGTRVLGEQLKPLGLAMVDAPVSGGVAKADSGALTIMFGCDDATVAERVQPVLRAMGERLFPMGRLGCGHAMKALNNFVSATAFASTAEALLIGERFGLDPAAMVDILNASTGRTFHSELVMKQQVLSGNFATGFSLGLLVKDVKIAADLGHAMDQPTPLADAVVRRWEDARDRLGAERDHTLAYKAWRHGPAA